MSTINSVPGVYAASS